MRLTEKNETPYINLIEEQFGYHLKPGIEEDAIVQKHNYYDAIDKLGQLEDIEDELGVDLKIFIKALIYGFYVKDNDFEKPHYMFSPCLFRTDEDYERVGEYIIEFGNDFIYLKDYGKTWALTKEELL